MTRLSRPRFFPGREAGLRLGHAFATRLAHTTGVRQRLLWSPETGCWVVRSW